MTKPFKGIVNMDIHGSTPDLGIVRGVRLVCNPSDEIRHIATRRGGSRVDPGILLSSRKELKWHLILHLGMIRPPNRQL
jgi:hypothetical protein